MTTEDLAYLAEACSANWKGISWAKPGSDELRRCTLVWREAIKLSFGSREFRRAVDGFIRRVKFPTWVLADFFEAKRTKVYGHAWYREKWPQHGAAEIGCYELDGKPVWGWRDELDGLLPVWETANVPTMPELPAARPDASAPDIMAPDTRAALEGWKADTKASIALDESEERRHRLQHELSTERRYVDRLRDQIAELEKTVEKLRADNDRLRRVKHG